MNLATSICRANGVSCGLAARAFSPSDQNPSKLESFHVILFTDHQVQ